jgi:hypothetical protein
MINDTIITLLRSINNGTTRIRLLINDMIVPVFQTDDGWKIGVFYDPFYNDGNFDYFEWVESPDGIHLDFDDLYKGEYESQMYGVTPTKEQQVIWDSLRRAKYD